MADTVTRIVGPTVVEVSVPGIQGPPGPQGPQGPASAQTLNLPAAHALSGHRAVVATTMGAAYADPTNPAHQDAVVGITTGAALVGETATIQAVGEMTEPSWSWTPGLPIFVGAGGTLTHTPPSSGWVQSIATALTAQRIFVVGKPAIMQ